MVIGQPGEPVARSVAGQKRVSSEFNLFGLQSRFKNRNRSDAR